MKKKLILPIVVLLLLSVFVVQVSAIDTFKPVSPTVDLTTKVIFKINESGCISKGKYQIANNTILSGLLPYEYLVESEKVKASDLPPLDFFEIERKGYTFVRWNIKLDEEATIKETGDLPTISVITPIKQTVVAVATPVWKPNVLTVHYNVNYSSVKEGSKYSVNKYGNITKNGKLFSQQFTYGAPKTENGLVNASTFQLQRPGYHFLGWSATKNGKVLLDQNTPMGAVDITKKVFNGNTKVTLYAQWIPKTVNIVYFLNDDTEKINSEKYEGDINGIKVKGKDVLYSQKYVYSKNKPIVVNKNVFEIEKPFSEFNGWSTKPNGKGTIFKPGQKITYKEILPLLTGDGKVLRLYPVWKSYSFPLDTSGEIFISSLQGLRIHPVYNEERYHAGLDIAAGYGTAIYAVEDGIVTEVGIDRGYGYGNYVQIDHGNGTETLYAHASKVLVKEGQKVKKGDLIARVGSTGTSTGNHLHLELKINSELKDPMNYIDFEGVPVRV